MPNRPQQINIFQQTVINNFYIKLKNGIFFVSRFLTVIIINETYLEDDTVIIQVEGKLDGDSVTALRDLCADHLINKKAVRINLDKVHSTDRKGIGYLRSIQKNVCLEGLNKYFELELAQPAGTDDPHGQDPGRTRG